MTKQQLNDLITIVSAYLKVSNIIKYKKRAQNLIEWAEKELLNE